MTHDHDAPIDPPEAAATAPRPSQTGSAVAPKTTTPESTTPEPGTSETNDTSDDRAAQKANTPPPASDNGLGRQIRGPGLSAKLLLLTALFVMLAEILIFVPSVSNFRINWLNDRITAARIAALAAEAAPDGQLSTTLRDELLKSTQLKAIAVRTQTQRRLIVNSEMPAVIDTLVDLRERSAIMLISDAVEVFLIGGKRMLRVVASPRMSKGEFIEIVLPEAPLKAAMVQFGLNILGLSIIISLLSAALVYLALNALLVRPMRRITQSMVRFSKDPEDVSRIISPSNRTDEVGIAEDELAAMQGDLNMALRQKNRLAALGLAVSKVNHDLRNMLSSAQLISDRLGTVDDPTVKRVAPKLINSLDRAIKLCTETLRYGSARENTPVRKRFPLAPLVVEVAEGLALPRPGRIEWETDIAPELEVDADHDQLYRVVANLCRNASQVLEAQLETSDRLGSQRLPGRICVSARRDGAATLITIEDNGPGMPETAREHLFDAFQGSARKGGTGLGLAISGELIRAHGGTLQLLESEIGTGFQITIPDTGAGV